MSRSEISVERELAGVVRDYLNANRPGSVPETVAIVAGHDSAAAARPYVEVTVRELAYPHPAMAVGTLELCTWFRVDEQGSTAAPEDDEVVPGYHVDLAAAVHAGLAGIQADLKARGGWLRKLVRRGSADDQQDSRGRRMVTRWVVNVQLAAP